MKRPVVLGAALTCGFVAACAGGEPAALRVGDLGFSAAMISALGEDDRASLADIAAFGETVREGRVDSLLGPLASRAADRSRLETLPYLLGVSAAGIDDARLRELYASSPEWELEVRHVVRTVAGNAPVAERRRELERATDVRRRALAGGDFEELAAMYSDEPGAAARGGALEPGRRGSWVRPFWDAALALRPGEISPVVETVYGFHVIRLDARRPIPFEEADRAALLRRAVLPEQAQAAMEQWAAQRPPITVAPGAVAAARRALRNGVSADPEVLAAGEGGSTYTTLDLARSWAQLEAERRESLAGADDEAVARWLENDAREALWAAAAERLGAPSLLAVEADTLRRMRGTVSRWMETFGFRKGMAEGDVLAAALRGTVARGQEALIARVELEALRPLLRADYPLVVPDDSAGTSSSSEMRKRETTG